MMFKNTFFPITIAIVLLFLSCGNISKQEVGSSTLETGSENLEVGSLKTDDQSPMTEELGSQTEILRQTTPIVGANQTERYLKLLQGKRVGIVANQTSVIFKEIATPQKVPRNASYVHLVDSLLSLKIDIKVILVPEHGFRGTADAGEHIKDGLDKKTGIPIISLYGDNKKPKLEQIKETKKYETDVETGVSAIDIMVFDLQDVGARFYTYISTLHYVMEACAEANVPLMILDRPNPNGNYLDGPILEKKYASFVGMHPVPVVYGMTIGEYAQMINGEHWLKNGVQCQLTVVPIKNYTHQTPYSLPIKPSPNLPNDKAINLYPSLCFFEGTNVSVGRGTSKQFQIYGSPFMYKEKYSLKFVPQPNEGAKYPMHQGVLCYGKDLSNSETWDSIHLDLLIDAYHNSIDKKKFFNDFFTNLAGTKKLREQIENGLSEKEIKATWEEGLAAFKVMRKPYLFYN